MNISITLPGLDRLNLDEGEWTAHITVSRNRAKGDTVLADTDSHFPDPVSQLMEDERRQQFGHEKMSALTYARTTGAAPFRFNLPLGKGHTLIEGPTGSGKSVLAALLAAQWLRYPNARVISFDKGRSMYALTEAVGGQHYDIAYELSDLARLDLSGRFTTFELENLPRMVTGQALLYLFDRIEQTLDGSPTLITLDEAWVLLDDPRSATTLRDWLRVLRKKNATVVFTMQTLVDLKDGRLLSVLQESCPTKIFLPNYLVSCQSQQKYVDFGLDNRQIEIIQSATQRRDYYISSSDGQHMVNFDLGPVARAFCCVCTPREMKRVAELKQAFGRRWPLEWLKEWLPNTIKDEDGRVDRWLSHAEMLFNRYEV